MLWPGWTPIGVPAGAEITGIDDEAGVGNLTPNPEVPETITGAVLAPEGVIFWMEPATVVKAPLMGAANRITVVATGWPCSLLFNGYKYVTFPSGPGGPATTIRCATAPGIGG